MQQVIWNLPAPLDERELERVGPAPTLVQFAGGLVPDERDHRLLGAFMKAHPETAVRLYGAHLPPDLHWLHHYSAARRITIDIDGITSFEALRSLRSDLEELSLGPCAKRRLSLMPLRHFTALRELALVGHQRDIEVIAELLTLERLTLTSVKLPSLDLLEPLAALRAFELKLGGTTNLSALPRIGRLRYLEIWRVNGLTDVGIIAQLPDLEYLFLQHLKRVDHLPSLAGCRRLRRVHLDRVGIHDLGPVAAAPRLEELLLLDMPQLGLDAFRPLQQHPTLRAVTAGVRNETRRAQIRAMLGLDDVRTYGTDFRFGPLVAAV